MGCCSRAPGPARWGFVRNMVIVICITAIAESSRGIIISSIRTYSEMLGGTAFFLGALIASFSVGRLVSSIILGHLSDRFGVKPVLGVSLLISVVGNLLYAFSLPVNSRGLLLFSRIVVGFGTGTLSVGRGYIASSTTAEERTRYISYCGAAQFLGFSITPGLGSLFALTSGSSEVFNDLTLPGYFMAVLNLIFFFILLFFLHEEGSPRDQSSSLVLQDQPEYRPEQDQEEQEGIKPLIEDYHPPTEAQLIDARILKFGLGLFLFLNLALRGVLGIAETVMPPLQMDLWQDDDGDAIQDTSEYFLVLGAVGFLVYLLVGPASKFVNEQHLLSTGVGIAALGFFVAMDFDNDLTIYKFSAGAFLIWSLASPICQTLVVSSFSKMLGSKPQGGAMGWITSAGSMGRIVFPLLSGLLHAPFSFLLGTLACVVCIAAIYSFALWRKRQLKIRDKFLSSQHPVDYLL